MIRNLGEMYLRAGKPAVAEASLREALRIRQKNRPDDHWEVADAQSMLGAALLKQGKLDDAEPLLTAGYMTLKRVRGEQDLYTHRAKIRVDQLHAAADGNI